MPSVVFRLWVIVLALLFQAGSWRSDTSLSVATANSASTAPADSRGAPGSMGDFDAQDDTSEEVSAVDDTFGSEMLPNPVPKWCSSAPSCRSYAWIDGLSPGGPPSDTPFKPPRS
jgi:hypothetical protein